MGDAPCNYQLSQCWLLSSIKRVVSQKRRLVSMETFLKRRGKPKGREGSIKRVVSQKRRLVSMETFLKRRGKPKGREGSVWQCLKAKANAL